MNIFMEISLHRSLIIPSCTSAEIKDMIVVQLLLYIPHYFSKVNPTYTFTKLIISPHLPLKPVCHGVSVFASFSSAQSLSCVWLFATPWTTACQTSLSITDSRSLPKLPIKSVMPSNHLIFCRPLLLLPPIPPSIRVFSNESALCMRWPKYWSFSFSISPSNEHSGFISFKMDWLDLLAVQETLKSLLQHHSSKASILWLSVFFIV